MTKNYDMTIDVDWAGTQEQRVGQVPPEIGEQEFEITKITTGVQKQGENLHEPFVNLLCTQMSGEFPGTRSTFKFIGFGKKIGKRGTAQIGETKAFIADIGRSDIFEQGTFNPEELLGTTFIANVAHSTNPKTGQTAVWLNQPRKSAQYAAEQYGAVQGAPAYSEESVSSTMSDISAIDAGFTVVDLPVPANRAVPHAPVAQRQAAAPAPAVEPRPAIPRRMRPTPQG
jgi:hypothetical protein